MKKRDILQDIEKVDGTIFDTIDLSIDKKLVGNALKERMAELTSLYGRIAELSSRAMFLKESQEVVIDKLESIVASELLMAGTAVSKIKFLSFTKEIEYQDGKTTLADEKATLAYYSYLRQRGINAMKQIDATVNSARSMLSWDKDDKDSYK